MTVKVAPDNRNFLYIVFGLTILLLGYRFLPVLFHKNVDEEVNVSFTEVRRVVGDEMNIRKRHIKLKEALLSWNGRFLTGTKRQTELALMKKIEFWAASSGLTYESTQIMAGKSAHSIQIAIRGNASYFVVRRFLKNVEDAPFAVTISSIRLKNEDAGENLRFELTLTAPMGVGRETLE